MYETTSYAADDAFITYRYAENLARGKGFVFNPGENVQGTSSPLYTILLTLTSFLLDSSWLPTVSRIISLVADGVSFVLLWRMCSSLNALAQFLAGALFALYPKVILIGISGMEASVTVMLMLLSFYLLQMHSPHTAFGCFGLLLLCRIDTVVWIFVCIAWAIYTRIKIPLSAILVFLSVYMPWVVFSWLFFGSWLPHTVIAKSVSWAHLFPAFDPVRVLLGYFPFQGLRGIPSSIGLAAVALFCVPVLFGLIAGFRQKDVFIALPVFFLLYNLAFSFGRIVMADRYYLPGYVAYFTTLGFSCHWLLQRKKDVFLSSITKRVFQLSVFAVLVGLIILGAYRWADNPGGLFIRQNKHLGIWLKEHAASDARVFLEPIGYVGWYSRLHIDDYIGLVSPTVISYREQFPGSNAWFMAYLKDKRPDYLVLRNWEVPRNELFHGHGDGLFQNEGEKKWFESNYLEINWNPQAAFLDSVYLVLYERRSTVLDAEDAGS